MTLYTSLQNFIEIGPPSAEKMMSCWFSRWRISAILDFKGVIMGSLKSPCTTSYKSSLDTIALNCLVFEKIAFFCILATDEQMDSIDTLSRSRCCQRRLNNPQKSCIAYKINLKKNELRRSSQEHTTYCQPHNKKTSVSKNRPTIVILVVVSTVWSVSDIIAVQ